MNYTPIKLKIKEWPEGAKAGAQGTTGMLEQACSYLVFASKDSKSEKQKFFSKGLFIWSIDQIQITKNTGTPMFMGYGKRIFKKINICVTYSLGFTPEANTS